LPEKLLEPAVQQYIRDNTGKPVAQLAMGKNPFPDVDRIAIINQIAAREKAKEKLPTWFAAQNILYPSKISVEQTSSETAAAYKAALVSGESLIDLTGGFGIDDYYFAKKIERVTHCEVNLELAAIAAHNFKMLGVGNIQSVPGDSAEALKAMDRQWDWIYADPSRRSDAKGKVFLLKDCLPNVPELLDFYLRYTHNVLIKTAPILDITAGLEELHSVSAIHIVAVNNEVKELLWIVSKGFKGQPMLHAVNVNKDGEDVFVVSFYTDATATYSLPQKYLYEPNSAIMKSGAFDAVSASYTIDKLHNNSHLYTSDTLIRFPGRRFIINQIIPYKKEEIRKFIQGRKMNVTARNFPIPVEELRKKWKIINGGDLYTFFTTNMNNEKIVLLCAKI
jgi:hypothetical protein